MVNRWRKMRPNKNDESATRRFCLIYLLMLNQLV